MGRRINGVFTIIHAARAICRMVALYGTASLTAATTPGYTAAVLTLVAACEAFDAADDYAYGIEASAPLGPEDVIVT